MYEKQLTEDYLRQLRELSGLTYELTVESITKAIKDSGCIFSFYFPKTGELWEKIVGYFRTEGERQLNVHFCVEVSSKDRIVTQGSKGNQPKWFKNGLWYKADYLGYEGCFCQVKNQPSY